MSDLSGWTEDSDGEVRQRLETRLMEIIGIEDDNERNQYIEHKIRCVRPHSQTGKRCGAKVVEVVRLDNLPLPTDLTIRAIRFRRALQDSLGVDRADFQNARDHALAFLEAKDDPDRKRSYRFREWDWIYKIEGLESLPGTELLTTACKCSVVDEYLLSVAQILSGDISTIGGPTPADTRSSP